MSSSLSPVSIVFLALQKCLVSFRPQYVLATALILFTSVVLMALLDTRHAVRRSQDLASKRVMGEAFDRVTDALLEAESAQRGYLLTGDRAFLDAFKNAEGEVLRYEGQMRRISPEDQHLVETLRRLTFEKLSRLRRNIDLRTDAGIEASAEAIRSRSGKDSIDEIRRILDDLRKRDRERLRDMTAAAERSVQRSLWSGILLLVVASALVGGAILLISRDSKRRATAERESIQAREKTDLWAHELEKANWDARFVNEFSDTLGVCLSDDEVHQTIAAYLHRLFPHAHGALAMIKSSRNMVEIIATWNSSSGQNSIYGPEDCHALRCGTLYLREMGSLKMVCRHFAEGSDGNYLCMPLIAQGETLGVLHLDFGSERWADDRVKLILNLVAHSSMKLANLKLRDTLRSQSIRDPLTGLYNRRYMEEAFERELGRADRRGSHVGVIMGDLDHFKRYNDTFGHEAGDRVLQEVATVLTGSFRREDIVCRYGGEEFVAIIPDVQREELVERAQLVCTRIRRVRIQHRGQLLGSISISLGVAIYPTHATTQDELLSKADAALFRAKRNGRDCVVECSGETSEEAEPSNS